jgi:hypothetical protein
MIRLLAGHIGRLHGGILAVARQDAPDVLVLTGITLLGGYHVAEGLGLHGMGLQLQPIRRGGSVLSDVGFLDCLTALAVMISLRCVAFLRLATG